MQILKIVKGHLCKKWFTLKAKHIEVKFINIRIISSFLTN